MYRHRATPVVRDSDISVASGPRFAVWGSESSPVTHGNMVFSRVSQAFPLHRHDTYRVVTDTGPISSQILWRRCGVASALTHHRVADQILEPSVA